MLEILVMTSFFYLSLIFASKARSLGSCSQNLHFIYNLRMVSLSKLGCLSEASFSNQLQIFFSSLLDLLIR
jgi:hypothetical protein